MKQRNAPYIPSHKVLGSKLDKLADAYVKADDALTDAASEQKRLNHADTLAAAERADQDAAEQAITAGKPHPGQPHTDQHHVDRQTAETRTRIAERERDEAAVAYRQALNEALPEVHARAREQADKAADTYRAAIDATLAARSAYRDAVSELGQLHSIALDAAWSRGQAGQPVRHARRAHPDDNGPRDGFGVFAHPMNRGIHDVDANTIPVLLRHDADRHGRVEYPEVHPQTAEQSNARMIASEPTASRTTVHTA